MSNQFTSKKIFQHCDHIAAWLRGENIFPVCVEIDMTNVCNNKCPQCTGGRRSPTAELSHEQAEILIRDLAALGVKAITFTGGGEPLCNVNVSYMAHIAHFVYGLSVGFITNGLLLTKEAAGCLKKCCEWIRVSLDAGTPEMYLKTHGVDCFDTVVKSMTYIVGGQATTGAGFLTDNETMPDMQSATKIVKEAGLDYIQFRPFHGKKFDLALFREEFRKCSLMATDRFSVLCSAFKYDNMDEKPFPYEKCYGHNFTAVIGADYKVYLCCHMRGNAKYCLGDLNDHTFEQIWNSKRRNAVIESIDFKDCVPFCRCDPFNRDLWNLKQPVTHKNFL